MAGPTLTRLHDPECGITVICPGHVSEIAFARKVDCDDVATFLGDDYDADDQGYPTEKTDERVAERVRHTWGKWSVEGGLRRWEEVGEDEPGAEPFSVIDENP